MASKKHRWVLWRAISRPMCLYCGLVWLKNRASCKAARKPCPGTQDDG